MQAEHTRAKRDLITWVQHDFGVGLNAVIVDGGAVRAAQIRQVDPFSFDLEQCVFTADTRVWQHNIVSFNPSESKIFCHLELNHQVWCDQLPAARVRMCFLQIVGNGLTRGLFDLKVAGHVWIGWCA